MNKQLKHSVRLGIIGVSGYAGILAENLQRYVSNGRAQWVAACGLNTPDDIARCEILAARGAKTYTNWRTLLDNHADELDLLVIATAIHAHREMAEYALSLGLRVFLEKPLAASMDEALSIRKAMLQSRGDLIIGYQNLCSATTYRIKQALLNKELGEVTSIRAIGCWPRAANYYTRNDWAGRLSSNGRLVHDSPVNNAMAHFLNLMLFWAGATLEKTARVEAVEGSVYRARNIESFDTASLRIHTQEGIHVEFQGTHSCLAPTDPQIKIIGSHGTVQWFFEGTAFIETPSGRQRLSHENALASRDTMIDTLIDWAEGKPVRACTIDQAIEQTRVIELIHRYFSIHTIPPDCIHLIDNQPVIENIVETLRHRFEVGGCLQQTDARWAAPPQISPRERPALTP